jgi:CRP/FNR family transcriptional regulator, cyclic AMP receptor protein
VPSSGVDLLGWFAAALMVGTFACRDAHAMRALAVLSNLAFVAYGVAGSLAPVVVLHLLLLPINLWRWREGADRSSSRT